MDSTNALLQLPDTAIISILESLDAKALVALSRTSKYFSMHMVSSGLRLTEHIARERVLAKHHHDEDSSQRFKYVPATLECHWYYWY